MTPMGKPNYSLIGFLAMAFAVVGLAGIMATYTVPVPLARAMAREAALDDALAALSSPNPREALEALRPRLADSVDAVLPLRDGAVGRVATERVAMRARLSAESAELGVKLRWMVVVLTLMALGFSTMLMQAARRAT
jgi:hypothetical protein